MKRTVFGPSSTVFILFFGLALIEAMKNRDWFFGAVFLVLGFLVLRADRMNQELPR